MYDTLLDEFDDDARVAVDASGFEAPEDDDEVVVEVAADSEAEEDEGLGDIDDGESWSDDPVRMYLTQMGEIPLLTRQEEITLAKRIEDTRRQFRTKLLECNYVIQTAFKVIKRVHNGELPFDRTVQVSVTDRLEKEQILGRLPYNVESLETLLRRNRQDYLVSLSKSQPKKKRREAWTRLSRRRRRCVRLIEELGLRTQRIEAMISVVEEFNNRVQELRKLIAEHKKARKSPKEREPWQRELHHILIACQETPSSLHNRVMFIRKVFSKYQKAKRALS